MLSSQTVAACSLTNELIALPWLQWFQGQWYYQMVRKWSFSANYHNLAWMHQSLELSIILLIIKMTRRKYIQFRYCRVSGVIVDHGHGLF